MKGMDIFNGTSDSLHELSWEAEPALSLPRPEPPPDQQLTDHSLSDIDFFFKIINEHRDQQMPSLPRPPSPPSGSHLQSQSTNVSKPRLVARGTACQASYNLVRPLSGSSRNMMATPPSCSLPGTELLERVLERPTLVVVEEPKDRGMRFRYECEGRSAGSILGASSSESSKTQPAIEIQGPIDHIKKVKVTVSLVTKDIPHRPHPHCLVGKDCPHSSGICVVTFNPHVNRRHSFANLGIQCVRRKELEASLQKRRSLNIDPFQTDLSRGIEDIDMNAVRLCFQCELEWEDGKKDCLKPVVSKPIYDKKATTTSQLKITRLNLDRGPCTGKTEVYMLCDKVQKDDIEIVFRRDSWKANGEFAQTDVHRQVGIVFKTPPYQDQNITEEVEVSLCLRRISDQMESEPVTFIYSPRNPDPYEVKRKRKIKSDMSFTERACTSEKNTSAADPFQISPNPPGSTPSSEDLLRAPPGPFQGEACYMEAQCPNMAPDEASLINQLMEMPGFMDIFSDPSFSSSLPSGFDQGPEASTTFTNMDMNSGPYFQDFSHYNDLQFNMLVNESQTASSEMVQVKTEDEV
ncbi:transcription factor RelB isoform X1 [Periophthalmus magnuspinnatus]|uniref:transcription factor RelB isoform X1 n=2 Tax=Periophthalmus magnuspinnatus TaxID=409849 RepID=UPI00145BF4E2|nr:transcription factor RelB isoform X1 [Periophthalmus magnuspinnatus]